MAEAGEVTFKAVLIGATGVTGKHVLAELVKSKDFSEVTVIGRRKLSAEDLDGLNLEALLESGSLVQHEIDMEKIEETVPALLEGKDAFFTTFGTTAAKAGSKANFYKIDFGYNLSFLKAAKETGIKVAMLMSTQGAKSSSWLSNYLKVKGQLEEAAAALEFPHLAIFRPGLLDRGKDATRGEKWAGIVMKRNPVDVIARAMVHQTLQHLKAGAGESPQKYIYSQQDIRTIAPPAEAPAAPAEETPAEKSEEAAAPEESPEIEITPASEESPGAPEESSAAPEESPAAPEESPAAPEGSPAAAEDTPAESTEEATPPETKEESPAPATEDAAPAATENAPSAEATSEAAPAEPEATSEAEPAAASEAESTETTAEKPVASTDDAPEAPTTGESTENETAADEPAKEEETAPEGVSEVTPEPEAAPEPESATEPEATTEPTEDASPEAEAEAAAPAEEAAAPAEEAAPTETATTEETTPVAPTESVSENATKTEAAKTEAVAPSEETPAVASTAE